MEAHDYSEDAGKADSDVTKLEELAKEQLAAERLVKDCEEQLTKAKNALVKINEGTLPELMDLLRIREVTLPNGKEIKVEEKIRASVPKARRAKAMQWLRDNNNAALITNKVNIDLGLGADRETVLLVEARLSDFGFEIEHDENVHHSRLTAFVKRRLEAGEDLPQDLFGVHRQRWSKIT